MNLMPACHDGFARAACRPRVATAGFTLIELLVTIAILAITLTLAAPSFVGFQRNAELTNAANGFLSALNAARSEAMKRNFNAMVVPADGSSWAGGWIVFVDSNRNNAFDDGSDVVVQRREALPAQLITCGNGAMAGSAPYLMYNGSGYSVDKSGAFSALTFEIRRNDVDSTVRHLQTRRLIISSVGRARVCTPSVPLNSACPSTQPDDLC